MGQKAAQLTRGGAQRKNMTQRRSPSREKSELPPPPQHTHMHQAIPSFQSSLAHKPDSCLHASCQAHRKSTRILRPNFPFAPRRRTLMKRPWRRRKPAACGSEKTGGGQGCSGNRSLPKGHDLPEQTPWATGDRREEACVGGMDGKAQMSEKEEQGIKHWRKETAR